MTRIPDPLVRHEWWFELMYIDDYRWRNDFADDLMMPNMALGVKMNICAAALMTTHVIQRVDRWKSWVACFSCLYLVIDQRSCFTVVLYSSLIHTQYNWPVNKFWLDWLDTHVQSKMVFFLSWSPTILDTIHPGVWSSPIHRRLSPHNISPLHIAKLST